MKNLDIYPDYRYRTGAHKFASYVGESPKCDISDIEGVSSEIALRKRISLTLLIAFVPFITALYLIASSFEVDKSYFIAFASIYGVYYLFYSMWACSSHCPMCGNTMSKKYLFILPSMLCTHCGHDLKHPLKSHRHIH
ncbi:MAG: hypothetical protein P8Z75_03520 [Gammaproteobacteria bacterium]|jgi:hypothetical protein